MFASGKQGAPGSLWNNARKRQQVEDRLATGDIELFGMTDFSNRDSSFEDYSRWIDLALEYNPATQIFIGQAYFARGPSMDDEAYARIVAERGEIAFEIVQELRAAYPDITIHYINYGKVAADMKMFYSAGQLPDITKVSGRGQDALFRDRFIGHAGPMIQELSALVWLEILYGAELEQLTFSAYESDVAPIIDASVSANEPYGYDNTPSVDESVIVPIPSATPLVPSTGGLLIY